MERKHFRNLAVALAMTPFIRTCDVNTFRQPENAYVGEYCQAGGCGNAEERLTYTSFAAGPSGTCESELQSTTLIITMNLTTGESFTKSGQEILYLVPNSCQCAGQLE